MLRARHARRQAHELDPIAAEVLVAPSPFAAPSSYLGHLRPQRDQRNAPLLRRTRTTRTGAGRSGESSMDTSSTTMPLTFSNRLNKPFNQGAFLGCISWSKNKPTGSAPHTLGFNGSPTNHHPRKQHESLKIRTAAGTDGVSQMWGHRPSRHPPLSPIRNRHNHYQRQIDTPTQSHPLDRCIIVNSRVATAPHKHRPTVLRH